MRTFIMVMACTLCLGVVSCKKKDSDEVAPMSIEDQIENSGDPIKYLPGEYFTHEAHNFVRGLDEKSDDPEGYGQVQVVTSRYFLVLVPKGADSLSASMKGEGIFGPLQVNLGNFGVKAVNTLKNEFLLTGKAGGLRLYRIAQSTNTLYTSSQIQFHNEKGEYTGNISFRRVSKGIVKK